jgi:RNA polymerase sigma-70 factor, ECF subfamily
MRETSARDTESHPALLDAPAWRTAYAKYRRFWLNIAKSQNISEEEAQDILHTILCSILADKEKQFSSAEHIRNYVARAILNRSVIARKEAGRKLSWNESIERLYPVLEDGDVEANSLRQAMREGLKGLSATAFQIIKLRFFAGLTFSEVSQMLDLPMSTVKSREEAAIKKIRASLRKKGF